MQACEMGARLHRRAPRGLARGHRRWVASVAGDGRISGLLALEAHRRSARRPRISLRGASRAVALLAVAAVLLAGCGGSSGGGGTSADPAGVVPASAPIYLGAEVTPEGALKEDTVADGRKLSRQNDPWGRLLAVLQTPGAPPLNYRSDIAPWLGPQAGIFLSSLGAATALVPLLEQGVLGGSSATASFPFGSHGAQGAIVLDTTDAGRARSFLETEAGHAGAHSTSYRGVSYEVNAAGVAFGLVDRFVVIGSEAGLHSVVDTELAGSGLKESSGYAKLLALAPAGALAHLYTNPTVAAEAGAAKTGAGLLGLLTGSREANISLVPTATSLDLYADTITTAGGSGVGGGLLAAGSEGAQAFDELPGNSWLAVGLAHLGSTLGQDASGLREIGALGSSLAGSGSGSTTSLISLKGLVEGLLGPLATLAADTPAAHHDFTSWMGPGGVYASGSGLLELKGAVVIESRNPTLSREAVSKLAAQLRAQGDSVQPASIPGTDAAVGVKVNGLPVILNIANGKADSGATKFVLGLGEASVVEALHPSSTMAGAASRASAAKSLGEDLQPSVLVALPTLLELLEGVGLTEDPTISKLVPSLHAITAIYGGGHSLGGEAERFKLVFELQ